MLCLACNFENYYTEGSTFFHVKFTTSSFKLTFTIFMPMIVEMRRANYHKYNSQRTVCKLCMIFLSSPMLKYTEKEMVGEIQFMNHIFQGKLQM